MAHESVTPGSNLFVEWGDRGLTFSIEGDELEDAAEHARKCGDSAVAVLRAIELALQNTRASLDEEQLSDAIAGASFLSGMAQQLRIAATECQHENS
jgi:hypothetical protein